MIGFNEVVEIVMNRIIVCFNFIFEFMFSKFCNIIVFFIEKRW